MFRNPDESLRKLGRVDPARAILENFRRNLVSEAQIKAAAILQNGPAIQICLELFPDFAIPSFVYKEPTQFLLDRWNRMIQDVKDYNIAQGTNITGETLSDFIEYNKNHQFSEFMNACRIQALALLMEAGKIETKRVLTIIWNLWVQYLNDNNNDNNKQSAEDLAKALNEFLPPLAKVTVNAIYKWLKQLKKISPGDAQYKFVEMSTQNAEQFQGWGRTRDPYWVQTHEFLLDLINFCAELGHLNTNSFDKEYISNRIFGIVLHHYQLEDNIYQNIANSILQPSLEVVVPKFLDQSGTRRNPESIHELTQNVLIQLNQWILDPKSYSENAWISAKEGQIYIRYTNYKKGTRCDLATFDIEPEFQQKGVATQIIQAVAALPIETVRIELIRNKGWAKKVVNMQLPGRVTKVISDGGGTPTVDFILQSKVKYRFNPDEEDLSDEPINQQQAYQEHFEMVWKDPNCGCERSPDAVRDTPCPMHYEVDFKKLFKLTGGAMERRWEFHLPLGKEDLYISAGNHCYSLPSDTLYSPDLYEAMDLLLIDENDIPKMFPGLAQYWDFGGSGFHLYVPIEFIKSILKEHGMGYFYES